MRQVPDSDILGLVLESSGRLEMYDVAAISGRDIPGSFRDEFEDAWDDQLARVGIDLYDLETLVSSGDDEWFIAGGQIDFAAVRDELAASGHEDDTYRGYELWEGGSRAAAIFEPEGMAVVGASETIRDIVQAVSRETGLLTTASDSDLKRALEKVGHGYVVLASVDCGVYQDVGGCLSHARRLSAGEGGASAYEALLFTSERRAQAEVEDIEDQVDGTWAVVEVQVEGEFVTVEATADLGVSEALARFLGTVSPGTPASPEIAAVPTSPGAPTPAGPVPTTAPTAAPSPQAAPEPTVAPIPAPSPTAVAAPAPTSTPAPLPTTAPAVPAPAPTIAPAQSVAKRVPEGSITVATRLNVESRHADPLQQVHGGYRTTHLNAYEGLTWHRPTDGALEGLLAKSWELGADNLSFTFSLQDDVTFWNGETMTADDVKFSWDRAVDPENKQYPGQEMRDGVESVSVIDGSTVKFNLLKPYGGLLERLFLFAHISPKTALEAGGMDFWMDPVGTGPLKFTDLQPGEYVKFEAHADYWNPEYVSSVQSIDMQNIEDPTARTAALTSGRVDIIGRVRGPMIAEIEGSSEARIVTVPGASITVLKFDHWVDDIVADEYPILDGQEAVDKYGPLGDMRVRRAISLAIDRQQIVDTLYGGYGIPWATAMCRTSNGYNDALEAHEYNPEMAKELLEEAGYADGFEYAYNMNAGNKDLAEAIAGYLREVGIEPELVLWDDATYRDKKLVNRADGFRGIREDPFGCIAMGESMAMLATWYTLNPAQGSFATPELDALIEKVTSTLDSDERAGYGREAAVELYDNMGDAGLWHLDALFGVGSRVDYYNPGPPNSQLVRLYTVQLKK